MASKIKVDQLEGSTGSTITVPTGQTLTITDGLAASTISSGTLADARLPTIPVAKGGTGLTSLGTAGQVVKVNSGANALEFGDTSSGGVLQAIYNANDTAINTSASNFVATNNSVTITPTASNSKILVILSGQVAVDNSSTDPWIYTRPYRDIGGGGYSAVSNYRRYAPSAGASIAILEDVNHFFIDAPSTTSAVTYKTYFHGAGTAIWFGGRSSTEISRTNAIAIELANGIA